MIHQLHKVTDDLEEEMNKVATLENEATETVQDEAVTELK